MVHRLKILLGLLLGAACTRDTWDAAAGQELIRRSTLDQAIRDTFATSLRQVGRPDSAVGVRMLAVDSANTMWLRSAVASRGWPRSSVVGEDVAEAAFLIVQHAPDYAFQAEVLKLLEPLATAGEVSGQHFALLSDRVAAHAGRPQLYGTQASIRDGRVVLHPIVDSSEVDARRARLGLPPLAVYVRMLDSAYGRPSNP
jgi:hypothetical protein